MTGGREAAPLPCMPAGDLVRIERGGISVCVFCFFA